MKKLVCACALMSPLGTPLVVDVDEAGEERVVALTSEVELTTVWIPPGAFVMGSPPDEAGRSHSYLSANSTWNRPGFDPEAQHDVRLTRGFHLGQTEITQAAWVAVMGSNPSRNRSGLLFPVENVSWIDAHEFLEKVNEGRTDGRFRLPTEAEWEYACRAGTTARFAGELDEIAWSIDNSGRVSHEVATREPNAWGVFDMHGNVNEWCEDRYGQHPAGAVVDPRGADEEQSSLPINGDLAGRRLTRGGGFTGRTLHCRSADRGSARPETRAFYVGFRVVFEASQRQAPR